jgi:hypothetical protein
VLILVGVGLEVAPSPGEHPSYFQKPPPPSCAQGSLQALPTPSRNRPPFQRKGRLAQAVSGPEALSCSPLPPAGVSSAIFFVPGVLLLVPGGERGPRAGRRRGGAEPRADWPRPAVYHVIFIYCAVKGHRGFQFFYLPYFEK